MRATERDMTGEETVQEKVSVITIVDVQVHFDDHPDGVDLDDAIPHVCEHIRQKLIETYHEVIDPIDSMSYLWEPLPYEALSAGQQLIDTGDLETGYHATHIRIARNPSVIFVDNESDVGEDYPAGTAAEMENILEWAGYVATSGRPNERPYDSMSAPWFFGEDFQDLRDRARRNVLAGVTDAP